jgi:hypothetical protein
MPRMGTDARAAVATERLPPELPVGDGLVLRAARRADGDQLAAFNAEMHADDDLPASELSQWTHDLFEVPHPTFDPERDVTVVEEVSTGRIVSALFLIPQTWTYAGLPIPVAQPELIATHPDHRRRGLVRAQFDVVHEWSRAAGHLWQFISGIPWYYRQFGYSYAIDLPSRPVLWLRGRPAEPPAGVSVRPATPADVAFLADVESQAASGTALGVRRGAEGFTLELARRAGGLLAADVVVIETGSAGPIGYAAYLRALRDGLVSLYAMELRPGHSWLAPTAVLVAHLDRWLRDRPAGRGIRFALPDGHPAIRSVTTRLSGPRPESYGLYVRVPHLLAALHAVTPVLEERVARSPLAGWTSELHMDLYTTGIRLAFEEGRLLEIEPWQRPAGTLADASLPVDAFVHLLLGNRRLGELERQIADVLVDTDAGALALDVLFPPMPLGRWEYC